MIAQHQKSIDSGFSRHSEPSQVLGGIDLSGRTALVTGGYSGIGIETVRALKNAGADVYVPARRLDEARKELAGIVAEDSIGEMDLGDPASVRRFAGELAQKVSALDILITNAGVMACPEQRTSQGWEWQFAVNHIGHFVLITELLPKLQAAAGGARVVCLSSIGHRLSGIRWDDMFFKNEEYNKWVAYGQAKTADSLMAVELDARYKSAGIRAFGVHPGGIFTPLQRHLDKEEMVVLGWLDKSGEMSERAKQFFKTPAQGATTSLWCATSPALAELGGVYCEDCNIAAVVDDESQDPWGVRKWAVDSDQATRLWAATEALLASS